MKVGLNNADSFKLLLSLLDRVEGDFSFRTMWKLKVEVGLLSHVLRLRPFFVLCIYITNINSTANFTSEVPS